MKQQAFRFLASPPACKGFATSQGTTANSYDIAIVGAGLTGAALAAGLGSNPLTAKLKVALLDKQASAGVSYPVNGTPANRVSTLTPASVKFLDGIGAWPAIAPARSAAFSQMQVWDSSGFVRYDAGLFPDPVMGYVAENNVIQQALMQKLEHSGRAIDKLWPVSLTGLQLPAYSSTHAQGSDTKANNAFATVQLQDGFCIDAKLVVGADGGNSRVRQMAHLRTISWSYNQRGLVATVATNVPNHTAWQVFLPNGPLALLPVRDGYSNIVWSTTPAQAAELEAMTPDSFVTAVNMAFSGRQRPTPLFGGRFGTANRAARFEDPPLVTQAVGEPPKSFPLKLCQAGRYVRPRLALVGDAAHAVHPLAGQGVNLGFMDVKALIGALAYATETGMDIGSMQVLEELYEQPQQRANVRMTAALDILKRVFQPQTGWTAGLRGVGLGLIHETPLIKNKIMQYAMGS